MSKDRKKRAKIPRNSLPRVMNDVASALLPMLLHISTTDRRVSKTQLQITIISIDVMSNTFTTWI